MKLQAQYQYTLTWTSWDRFSAAVLSDKLVCMKLKE